ncbi:uncharacterized protein [Littorina saxatilis]|uniref:Interferon-induced transmembrane protein n=1 Tax=Littorina saxatilis TaxID=31220 RepID=A0AAN9BZP6_9CAEN
MADTGKNGIDNMAMTGDYPSQPQPQGYGMTSDPYAYSQPQGPNPPPYVTQPQYGGPYAPPPNVGPYGAPVIVTTQPIRESGTPPETGCSLVVSILSIFFCLGAWPFAVVAIVFNRKAHGLVQQGQYTTARGALRTMYIFLVITFVLGIIVWVITGMRIKYTIDAYNAAKRTNRYYYG